METLNPSTISNMKENQCPPPPNDLENLPNRKLILKSKDNVEFNVIITQAKDNIVIIANIKEDIKATQYKSVSSLKEFQESNNYFHQYDSIEKLFSQFILDISEQEFEIELKENKINLNIFYEIRKRKIEKQFILNPQEVKIDDIVTNLCFEIDLLRKENHKQINQIMELKKANEEQIKINKELKEELQNMKENLSKISLLYQKEIETKINQIQIQQKENLCFIIKIYFV